jgi:hypothetical protein
MNKNKLLEQENSKLRSIIWDTLWMARRYAHNRNTYAKDTIEDAVKRASYLGIDIEDDHTLESLIEQPSARGKNDSQRP